MPSEEDQLDNGTQVTFAVDLPGLYIETATERYLLSTVVGRWVFMHHINCDSAEMPFLTAGSVWSLVGLKYEGGTVAGDAGRWMYKNKNAVSAQEYIA